ncbi:MFS transporter [Nocardioides sp. CER19]|uniref:MFS transporter n=1 Tax=Nocardioides sp. CER19 TaxID=3038538 RepID=UPI002446DD39|nr:MFS transporter [Nocardioides sp. CER19]MDH2413581.1 MFS transporter [Nocardioides sp. CER19]
MTTTLTIDASAAGPAAMSRRQLLVLALLLASQFTLTVDFSILNVALPTVGAGLGFSSADVQWIATSFALCAAGFTLLFGRVGDYLGRRRIFLAGMVALGLASLLGGLATSPAVLLTARVIQGLATAAVTPAALSLLTVAFPEGPLRRRALGLNSVVMSAGFTGGAILGGVLTDLLSWRWAFLVNVPITVAVVAVAPFVLADSPDRERSRLDAPGAALVTGGLLSLVYAATRLGEQGVSDPWGLAALLLAIVLLAGFVRAEGRHTHPLVPLPILRRRTIFWGNVAGFVTFSMEPGLVFLSTLYFQNVLGLDPLQTGLMLGTMGAGALIGGTVGPRVIGVVGVRGAAAGGLTIQAVTTGLLILLGHSAHASLPLYGIVTFVGAIGHVCAIVAFMVAATSGLPDREQGLATGIATMTQQVAIAVGVPLVSAIATAAGGIDSLTALRAAVGIDAGLVLVGALLVAGGLRPRAPEVGSA